MFGGHNLSAPVTIDRAHRIGRDIRDQSATQRGGNKVPELRRKTAGHERFRGQGTDILWQPDVSPDLLKQSGWHVVPYHDEDLDGPAKVHSLALFWIH